MVSVSPMPVTTISRPRTTPSCLRSAVTQEPRRRDTWDDHLVFHVRRGFPRSSEHAPMRADELQGARASRMKYVRQCSPWSGSGFPRT